MSEEEREDGRNEFQGAQRETMMMPPPRASVPLMPALGLPGRRSAHPPPERVDAAAPGVLAATSTARDPRPDSGVDLDLNEAVATPDEYTNGAHKGYDKPENAPDAPDPDGDQNEGLRGPPAPVPSTPTHSMISSETSPATCLTSEHPTQGQAARKIVEGGRYQGLTDQSPPVASDGHSQTMERDLTHDASFLQATEFPGFPRPNNTGPAESPSGKRPFPSELSEGSEERPAYRQRSHTDFSESSSHGRDPSHRNGTPTPERASESTQAAQITSAPRSENPAVAMDAPIEPAPSEPSGITQTQIDSAFDDGASASFSLTDTLNSSVSDYRWENGRRYHAYRDGAYWGPNDELHNDQQDIAHKAWTLSIGNRLFQAPLDGDKVHRALDVGTGTGLWAIEFAELFPDAQVTGTDLSPIQPDWVPPNCMFEVDDVTLDWTFRKNSFDFIHSREMFGSIADWDFFFAQCYAHCKPGGYVECLERGVKPLSDDGTVGPDHFYTLWGQTVLDMGRRWGKGFDAFEIIKEKMERAGFVDVVETKMKWPIGGWPKDRALRELGLWNAVRLDTGIEGYVMRLFTQAGGWSYADVQVYTSKFRACMRDPSLHAYLPGTCVYGRKPPDSGARNGDVLVDDEGVEFS